MRRLLNCFFLLTLLFPLPMSYAASGFFKQLTTLRFGREEIVEPKDGVVQLQNLGPNEYFHVQGEIMFFPGVFLDTKYLGTEEYAQLIQEKAPIKASLNLKSFTAPLKTSETNYGTYVLRFSNTGKRQLAIAIPRVYHPASVYIVQERSTARVLQIGKLDPDPGRNKNFNTFLIPNPMLDLEGDFLIYAHVSTPLVKGINTLNFASFYVGNYFYLSEILYKTRFYAKMIAGAFFIVFLFYFFIYMFRSRDKSSLFLSAYALLSFGMSLIYVIDNNFTPAETLDYFTIMNLFGVVALQFYLFDKLSFLMSAKRRRIFMGLAVSVAVCASSGILLKIPLLVALFFLVSFVSSSVLIFATLYLGLKHKLSGIIYFLIGTVLNSTFQFPIMIGYIAGQNVENGYNIMLANFSMAIAIALVNAKEFAVTYQTTLEQGVALEEKNKEITFFNKNLEKLVDNKTKEIRSLLDYIPQGVLSLGADGIIAKDYSAHLYEILETQDIAKRTFKDLILDHCLISSDSKDQAWQSILSIAGESEFNYIGNAEKLPSELVYVGGKLEKYLKVTWNVDIEDDTVQRMLVTLLDVSHEKKLELQAAEQRRELEMLQELLNVPAQKAAQFFSTSEPLLLEIQRLLGASNDINDPGLIRNLFVNAHTVKGAARTLQLKELARTIHETEEVYADIIKARIKADRQRMQTDIAKTLEVFRHYEHINHSKLNRNEDYNKVAIERGFIEQHYQFLKNLSGKGELRVEDILDALKAESESLTQLIFDLLPGIIDSYKDKAQQIAKDLGKAPPRFDIQVDNIAISPEKRALLDNCMIHMLRNALDHGIEGVDERRRSHKPDQGCITIKATQNGQLLSLRISDDGRGLAIAYLAEKGRKQGILAPEASPSEIAELIFRSGISTAQQVSDISGRGVGMDAVRTFLEKAGGGITIELGEAKNTDKTHYNFSFVLVLPLEELVAKAA